MTNQTLLWIILILQIITLLLVLVPLGRRHL